MVEPLASVNQQPMRSCRAARKCLLTPRPKCLLTYIPASAGAPWEAKLDCATGKLFQGVMSTQQRVQALPSRAWSANSLAAGAEHCLTRAGMPLSHELTREQLLQRLKDFTLEPNMHVTLCRRTLFNVSCKNLQDAEGRLHEYHQQQAKAELSLEKAKIEEETAFRNLESPYVT